MRARPALLALLLLASGCSARDRSNPFDPLNPATGGSPVGFRALAANAYVRLEWIPLAAPDLDGYRLERRTQGDSAFVQVSALAPEISRYYDFGLANGVRYDYRLRYVFVRGASPAASEDYAVPAPLRAWAVDLGLSALLQLTPDGHHVADAPGAFDGPTNLAVDPIQGLVWVSDPYAGLVTQYNPANQGGFTISSLVRPSAIAVDARNHTAWVCDERQGLVAHFQSSGATAAPSLLGPLTTPIAIACDPMDGSVWICDNGALELRQFGPAGDSRWALATYRPSRIAVDSLTREGWMTSFEGRVVLRVGLNGTPLDTIGGFAGPIGIAVDAARGRVWVADAVAGQLVALRRDGTRE